MDWSVCHGHQAVGVTPTKHETSNLCFLNVGTPSATLVQHQTNIGSTSRVCRECHLSATGSSIVSSILDIPRNEQI